MLHVGFMDRRGEDSHNTHEHHPETDETENDYCPGSGVAKSVNRGESSKVESPEGKVDLRHHHQETSKKPKELDRQLSLRLL